MQLPAVATLYVTISFECVRILEQFILHGENSKALEKVIAELGNNHRQNPQELDRAVAGHLRQVQQCLNLEHHVAVTQNFRKDWRELNVFGGGQGKK